MRKSFDKEFMARVALEAIKEEKTIAEIPSQYEVHRTQITKWRKRSLEGMVGIFQGKEGKTGREEEKVTDELYIPVVINLLENVLPVSEMALMLQQGITERMTVLPGTREYGILSVIIQTAFI